MKENTQSEKIEPANYPLKTTNSQERILHAPNPGAGEAACNC